jgi:hypothetical protein
VNVALEAVMDRTTYLSNRSVLMVGQTTISDTAVNAPTADVDGVVYDTTSYEKSTGWVLDFAGLEAGQVVVITFAAQVRGSGTGDGMLRLYTIEDYGGTNVTTGYDQTKIWVNDAWGSVSENGVPRPVTMSLIVTVGTTGDFRIGVEGRRASSGTISIHFDGAGTLRALVLGSSTQGP